MKPIRFHKMHAGGNDFIILQRLPQDTKLTQSFITKLCDRRRGVGCDQLLLITPEGPGTSRYRYQIFNADGQEAEQCGNGARCVGELLRRLALCKTSEPIELITSKGVVRLDLSTEPCRAQFGPITVKPASNHVAFIEVGNPHWVCFVESMENETFISFAENLQTKHAATHGINVERVTIITPNQVTARVFERGVGETPACGSGALAIAAAGQHLGLLQSPLTVSMPGGTLRVDYDLTTQCAWLCGETHYIFTGEYDVGSSI